MNPNGTHHSPKIRRIQSGDYIREGYVPPFLVERLQRRIADPTVPSFIAEDGESFENPTDPDYLAAMQQVEGQRTQASMIACVIYGMKLVDEDGRDKPPGEAWLRRVKWLLGDEYNPYKPADFLDEPEDEDTRREAFEASYLLCHALGVKDMEMIGQMLGQPTEEYEAAMNTFRGS